MRCTHPRTHTDDIRCTHRTRNTTTMRVFGLPIGAIRLRAGKRHRLQIATF